MLNHKRRRFLHKQECKNWEEWYYANHFCSIAAPSDRNAIHVSQNCELGSQLECRKIQLVLMKTLWNIRPPGWARKGRGFPEALTTMQMCIVLVFVRPRVESRLTIHCEGLRSSLADCESKKMRKEISMTWWIHFGTCGQCGTWGWK